MSLKTDLEEYARSLNFAKMRVTTPDAIPTAKGRLREFLDFDFHGEMTWLTDRFEWRSDPAALWPKAKSVIVVADTYAPESGHEDRINHADRAVISVYAQNKDYHDVLKKRLKALGRFLLEHHPGEEIKVFVDTAPVMEKPLAEAAGLGWQGKHTNLVGRDLGNWFFLGVIFTTLKLAPDEPAKDSCGNCNACLTVCPTDAFPKPYVLDARKCISYLTIEHKGPVEEPLRSKLGNRIYGCDDCLAVCPWNKFASESQDIRYAAREELKSPKLSDLVLLDDTAFRAMFSGSPIKRIGRNRFIRNVLYAIGNSQNAELIAQARTLTQDPDEVVADAAIWACKQLKGSNNAASA